MRERRMSVVLAGASGKQLRANECMFIARECDLGWQHLNADWVVLEPIDQDGRPTAPVASRSVC
jgi:hypothetical protein